MKEHKISWLNIPGYIPETWNPIIGCSHVSPGCDNCYAERMAFRLANMGQRAYWQVMETNYNSDSISNYQPKWSGYTRFVEWALDKPAQWKKPRAVFVCSMSDLFHENNSFEWIDSVFSVMSDCDKHIYILLTKRPERIVQFYDWKKGSFNIDWIPKDNIWFGITAENQNEANNRLHYFNYFYAAVKFVSIEPMLSSIDFEESLGNSLKWHAGGLKNCISWVICGGESGNKARPMHPDWARFMRDQCAAYEVPFFFKQWGEWGVVSGLGKQKGKICFNASGREQWIPSVEGYAIMKKIGRKSAGDLLDGIEYHEFPKI